MRRLAAFAAAAVLAVQIAGAGPARANTFDLACNYDGQSYNACLDFQYVGELDMLNAHLGLDWHVPQRYAQDLVDYGTDFRAQLFADDNGQRRVLADLTVMPGWPAAGPDGLGVEMVAASLPRHLLDEDPGSPDQDELIAEVSFWDHNLPGRVRYFTGMVHGDFAPMTGGGWQCFSFC